MPEATRIRELLTEAMRAVCSQISSIPASDRMALRAEVQRFARIARAADVPAARMIAELTECLQKSELARGADESLDWLLSEARGWAVEAYA
ncbi:MAG TPA: hypothetical protein VFK13_01435 [Gemmatimonadaceae bacterium]|nr:hypothetical protein [Gemmatimonadaceae bacterium]